VIDTQLIDGKAHAARLREAVAAQTGLLRTLGIRPSLCTVLVGDDPVSQVYVRNKSKATAEAGLTCFEERLPASASEAELLTLIARLNADDRIDGILVQLPLPPQITRQRVIEAIDPAKDVDGFHPQNTGQLWGGGPGLVPCTPYGCLLLLRETAPLAGAEAVVVGRSNLVGKPMAALLLQANCTVTVAHSISRDLPAVVRRADILVVSIGRPELVRGAWLKPGVAIIDVGINRVDGPGGKSRLVGDVAFAEARGIAAAITPVPGGVGPMTIACLLRNTLIAACRRRGLPEPSV
jgi:methylenetetrahydrofolate dehydrogenase (NADP+) / methenyltetrahydrofolate cyclohydrolase